MEQKQQMQKEIQEKLEAEARKQHYLISTAVVSQLFSVIPHNLVSSVKELLTFSTTKNNQQSLFSSVVRCILSWTSNCM